MCPGQGWILKPRVDPGAKHQGLPHPYKMKDWKLKITVKRKTSEPKQQLWVFQPFIFQVVLMAIKGLVGIPFNKRNNSDGDCHWEGGTPQIMSKMDASTTNLWEL